MQLKIDYLPIFYIEFLIHNTYFIISQFFNSNKHRRYSPMIDTNIQIGNLFFQRIFTFCLSIDSLCQFFREDDISVEKQNEICFFSVACEGEINIFLQFFFRSSTSPSHNIVRYFFFSICHPISTMHIHNSTI